MFIAPVNGTKKPHVAYSNVVREIGNANENLEDQEKNGSTQSHALQLKTRLENIEKRPNKPGSKVRLYYNIIA